MLQDTGMQYAVGSPPPDGGTDAVHALAKTWFNDFMARFL
jgi:hypothetical protein